MPRPLDPRLLDSCVEGVAPRDHPMWSRIRRRHLLHDGEGAVLRAVVGEDVLDRGVGLREGRLDRADGKLGHQSRTLHGSDRLRAIEQKHCDPGSTRRQAS